MIGAENATLPHASFDVKFSTGILFGDDLAYPFQINQTQCLHQVLYTLCQNLSEPTETYRNLELLSVPGSWFLPGTAPARPEHTEIYIVQRHHSILLLGKRGLREKNKKQTMESARKLSNPHLNKATVGGKEVNGTALAYQNSHSSRQNAIDGGIVSHMHLLDVIGNGLL